MPTDFSRRAVDKAALLPKQFPSPYSVTGNSSRVPTTLTGVYTRIPAGCTLFQMALIDPAGSVIGSSWITILIPPTHLTEEMNFLANTVRVREGFIMDRWGMDLQTLIVAGKTGGFFTDSGLTSVDRDKTVAYQNLLALFELYRHNSIYSLSGNPVVPDQAGRVLINFGLTSWIGRFDRFNIKEDKPYQLDYDFAFVVYSTVKPTGDIPKSFRSFDISKLDRPDPSTFRPKDVDQARHTNPTASSVQCGGGGISSSAKESAGIKGGQTGSVGNSSTPKKKIASSAGLSSGSPYSSVSSGSLVEYPLLPGKYSKAPGRNPDMTLTPKASNGLDALSNNVQQPMQIYSASENSSVHSSVNSQHYKHNAVDISKVGDKTPNQMTSAERQDFLNNCKKSGAGFAQYEPGNKSGHFHVDWGPKRGAFA